MDMDKIGETMTFEQAMARLEEIVRKLEQSDAALEESLTLFEEGSALVRFCSTALDAAEKRVSLLLKAEGDTTETVPFSDEGND